MTSKGTDLRVVVTGGAGFIGANLCRALLAAPEVATVVALDDLSTGSRANLDGVEAELVEGSILDRDVLRDVVRGADAVVHLAARPSVPRSLADPVATHTVNATGTLEVLEAVRLLEVPQIIVASSSSVYGASTALPKTETLPSQPLSPYAASKLATESYALAHQHSFGIGVLALRFFNVFGPLQAAGHAYAAVVPAFVDAALRGEPLPVYGDGQQTRDFTYVGSVCSVLTRAVVTGVHHDGPVNLAFGTRVSLLTLIETLGEQLGATLEVDHRPARRGDVRDSQADTARLHSLFPGLEPVPLATGLAATIAWFRESVLVRDQSDSAS